MCKNVLWQQRGYIMFKLGDTVLYGACGVCKIEDIAEKSFGSSVQNYYVLVPLNDKRSTFFVPVNSETLVSKMRFVMSAEEINSVIKDTSNTAQWIENHRKRKDVFKNLAGGGNFKETLSLARCIHNHGEEISGSGKKLHKNDEMLYKEAMKVLCEEISFSMNITKEEAEDLLIKEN